jgi:hypothetical protein
MPSVGFELTILASKRAETVHASEGAATVIGEMEIQLHGFLTSAMDGGAWSVSRSTRSYSR